MAASTRNDESKKITTIYGVVLFCSVECRKNIFLKFKTFILPPVQLHPPGPATALWEDSFTLLYKAQLSPSRNPSLIDNFLQRTPIPNLMKIRQTLKSLVRKYTTRQRKLWNESKGIVYTLW